MRGRLLREFPQLGKQMSRSRGPDAERVLGAHNPLACPVDEALAFTSPTSFLHLVTPALIPRSVLVQKALLWSRPLSPMPWLQSASPRKTEESSWPIS